MEGAHGQNSSVMDHIEGKGANELLQAQALLWSHVFNHIDSMSLKCAVELGIPDAIHNHGRPITLPELLSALSIPPTKAPYLRRLMRMLTFSGFFTTQSKGVDNEEDEYSLTLLSHLLVRDKDVSLSQFLIATLHPVVVNPFQFMSAWFRGNEACTPFSLMYGCGFWDMTDRDPKFNKVFNDGMASDTRFLMDVLLKECGHVFGGLRSLVDVGGGTGSAATTIAKAFPQLKCYVMDLPQVVETLPEKGTVDFIAGDMFSYIPPADAVFLKWILHDWGDDDCVKILQRCKEAIPLREAGGKVIIIDMVLSSNSSHHESSKAQLFWDMLMMVECGGAERGEEEWRKIFIKAGFTDYKITPTLGLLSVIEVYP